jgi:hypothetical protein
MPNRKVLKWYMHLQKDAERHVVESVSSMPSSSEASGLASARRRYIISRASLGRD